MRRSSDRRTRTCAEKEGVTCSSIERLLVAGSEQAHETPADPGVGGSTPFDIGEDADADPPVRIESDGAVPLRHDFASEWTRSDEMSEGTLPDAENDFRVGWRSANGNRRWTVQEVCIRGRVGNVGQAPHRYRTPPRETQGGAQVAGHRTAVDAERRIGDHQLPASAVETGADQIVHEAATGESCVLPGGPLQQAPTGPTGNKDGKQEDGPSPARRPNEGRQEERRSRGRQEKVPLLEPHDAGQEEDSEDRGGHERLWRDAFRPEPREQQEEGQNGQGKSPVERGAGGEEFHVHR